MKGTKLTSRIPGCLLSSEPHLPCHTLPSPWGFKSPTMPLGEAPFWVGRRPLRAEKADSNTAGTRQEMTE